MQEVKNTDKREIHRYVARSLYQSYVPAHLRNQAFVYPFSIQKRTKEIYGIIFCCKNPLAAEKFLHIAWRTNSLNGEANYDINHDLTGKQGVLFGSHVKEHLTNRERIEREIKDKIFSKKLLSSEDLYYFVLDKAFSLEYARDFISRLRKEGFIDFQGRSSLSYETTIKKGKVIHYKVLKKT